MQGLSAPQQVLHKVRHRNAHKGDGTGEGRDAGRQQTGKKNQKHGKAPHRHTHAPGVALSHLVGPHGLRKQKGPAKTGHNHHSRSADIGPIAAGKAAHGPVVEVHDVGILGKGHHEIRDGGADIADHDAADHENPHLLHPPGHRQHEKHRQHCPDEGREDQGGGAHQQALIQKQHHGQSHRQLGAAGNAHDEGPCDGVREKGLEQVARRAEGSPQKHRHQGPGQPELQKDAVREPLLLPGQHAENLRRRQSHTAPEQIHDEKQQQSHGHQKICNCQSFSAAHKHFLNKKRRRHAAAHPLRDYKC